MRNLALCDHLTGQECPDGSHSCQYGRCDEQEPIKDTLSLTDLFPEDFQIKCKWEDDADCETQKRSQECHNSVKGWEYNGQSDHESHGEDSNHPAEELLYTLVSRFSSGIVGGSSIGDPKQHFECGYQRPRTVFWLIMIILLSARQSFRLTSMALW